MHENIRRSVPRIQLLNLMCDDMHPILTRCLKAIATWKRDFNRLELKLEFRRFRLVFSKEKFNQVDTLSKRDDELSKLLQASDNLAPARKRRQQGSITSFLRNIQAHARELFNVFNSSWQCQCQHTHPVSLRMEGRLKQKVPEEKHLRLLLAPTGDPGAPITPKIEVHITEDPGNCNSTSMDSSGKIAAPIAPSSLHET